MSHQCSACGALMFKGEQSKDQSHNGTFSLCCSHGHVKISPIREPPNVLKALLTGSTQRDWNFRNNIRAYNSSLAFASMCLTGKEFKFTTNGSYCNRINGQVYHAISQMQPKNGKAPAFSQIYIYDDKDGINNHLQACNGLDRGILQELQKMIKEVNPYAKMYNHVGNVIKENPTEDIQLALKTTRHTVDPRRYNLPTGTDVAVIIPTENSDISSQDVVVYKSVSQHLCWAVLDEN